MCRKYNLRIDPPHLATCYVDSPMTFLDLATRAFNTELLKDEASYARVKARVEARTLAAARAIEEELSRACAMDEELARALTDQEEEVSVLAPEEKEVSDSSPEVKEVSGSPAEESAPREVEEQEAGDNEVNAPSGSSPGDDEAQEKVKFARVDGDYAASLVGEAEDLLEDIQKAQEDAGNEVDQKTSQLIIKLKEQIKLDRVLIRGAVKENEKQAAVIREFHRSTAADLSKSLIDPLSGVLKSNITPVSQRLSKQDQDLASIKASMVQLRSMVAAQQEDQGRIEPLLRQMMGSSQAAAVPSTPSPGFPLGSAASTPAHTPIAQHPTPNYALPPPAGPSAHYPPPFMPASAFFPGQVASPPPAYNQPASRAKAERSSQRLSKRWSPASSQPAALLPLAKKAKTT